MEIKHFNSVLIANRGEVACRIIKTLKKLDIKSVAVYSDFDANSLHVRIADEAIYIGPSLASQSYLNITKICDAAEKAKVDAVHPGFGFLSENYLFPQSLKERSINFIGPSSSVILLMGDKIRAKQVAHSVGIPLINGYIGAIEDIDMAIKIAENIGFPVLLKAAAGGGGKGMRLAYNSSQLQEAIENTTNESIKSFADGRIFIEKYIEQPRHIEIQLLGDQHGNIIALGERECSIQRRYQKIIEEAPSSAITEEIRQNMYKQSLLLAKEVQYYSAGTVEFLLDQDKNFYFMEMNTRIQVEHPITELVTGIDIVEEMIRVAEGKKLPFTQADIKINGWAIEGRVYAEDPANNFFPTTGFIKHYLIPPKVRVDSGISAGEEVGMYYDPMLAKVCAHGATRLEAIKQLQEALDNFYIDGVTNNLNLLSSIVAKSNFLNGNTYTDFITKEYPNGFISDKCNRKALYILIAVASYLHLNTNEREDHKYAVDQLAVIVNSVVYKVRVEGRNNFIKLSDGKNEWNLQFTVLEYKKLLRILYKKEYIVIKIFSVRLGYILTYRGIQAHCLVMRPEVADLYSSLPSIQSEILTKNQITTPITGVISKMHINLGDVIQSGQPLFVIEAMKMENTFYAETSGKVEQILKKEGISVHSGELIIKLSN